MSATYETFTPDNLIAGPEEIVTEEVLIASGANLLRGTVLGRVKATVPTTGVIAGTGNGTCTAVTGGPKTQVGSYVATCFMVGTNISEWMVKDPNGKAIGTLHITPGAGGTGLFKSDEINFTITDGSTDFAVGDTATIAVTGIVPTTGVVTGTGNGTCTGVQHRRNTRVGAYVLTCTVAATNAGTFSVLSPSGSYLKDATVGVAYESDEIAFLINDGSTDFIVGDYITITVAIHPRQCKKLDKAATDGSSAPYAVLLKDAAAASAAVYAPAAKSGAFNERSLIFATGTTLEDVRNDLLTLGLTLKGSQKA